MLMTHTQKDITSWLFILIVCLLPRYLESLDVIRHPSYTQLRAELSPFTSRTILDHFLHVLAVPLGVSSLDLCHVLSIPVVSHQSGSQQLTAQAVFLGSCECMVHKLSVTSGFIDDAVENMCEKFAL